MVRNLNDIYKLIISPEYKEQCFPWKDGKISYSFRNTIAPQERIRVEFNHGFMEIYKYKNMNSEYYARISCNTKRGRKFNDALFKKHMNALWERIKENCKCK